MIRFLVLLISFNVLLACSEQNTGPVKVHWDRDTCERCRMVVSDPKHAAQVRYRDEKNKSRIHSFDDIGCAVIWLDKQAWRDAESTEVWVTDHRDGKWIDATKAFYITGQITPMEYGLGAQDSAAEGSLDYTGAKKHIYSIEKRYNKHGGGHQH